MKKIVTVCLVLTMSVAGKAQQSTTVADCNCPKPKDGKFINICTLVENQDFAYKNEIMQMSCVDVLKDSKETIRKKVNCMWEKYFHEFSCEGESFILNGNILKYAINQGFEFFIDGMVKDYGININFKDPADGKTLLDYTFGEIEKYKKYHEYHDKKYPDIKEKVKELEIIYDHLKFDLYALHANELTSKPHYQSGVKIILSGDISTKYTGSYAVDIAPTNVYTVVFENDKLLMSLNGSKYSELHAESENTFFLIPKTGARYRFTKNKEGKYDLTFGTNKNKATKVK